MMTANQSRLLLLAAAAIVAAPLAVPQLGGAFLGTDDLASAAIKAANPNFQPWFKPIWAPPSPEIETMLFSLQAAIGAGILGYLIGRRRSSGSTHDTRR